MTSLLISWKLELWDLPKFRNQSTWASNHQKIIFGWYGIIYQINFNNWMANLHRSALTSSCLFMALYVPESHCSLMYLQGWKWHKLSVQLWMLKQHTKAKRTEMSNITNHSRTTRLTRDLQQFPVKIMEDFGHNQEKYQWMNVKLEEHQIAPCSALIFQQLTS